MATDPTRMCALLVGLDDVRVLGVHDELDGSLTVAVETTADEAWCPTCGCRALVKDRRVRVLGDLTVFGRHAQLEWRKRRWHCGEAWCPARSWTETNEGIASPRCGLTRRAGLWACRQVGFGGRAVSAVAAELGVSWWAVMSAVRVYGTPLVEDGERVGAVEMLGVDETSFLKARPGAPTRWVSGVVDVGRHRLIDVIEGRNAAELSAWLLAQPGPWRQHVTVTVCDLHEPFRAAFAAHLGHATQVADPFHVVGVGTRTVDRVRRRVQTATLGHRGRRHDPLYRCRKLLALAAERLDESGEARLRGLLAAGDPAGEVYTAWNAKESLRDLYTLADDPDLAGRWLDRLIDDCAGQSVAEVRSMGHTLGRWRSQILAWHTTAASNGPAEALNSLIKKVKRVGHGFRSFANYRIRVLLYAGACDWSKLGASSP